MRTAGIMKAGGKWDDEGELAKRAELGGRMG